VAPRRQPKTLLEWNALLSLGSLMTEEQRTAGKKLPLMGQARLMVKAMPRATRVARHYLRRVMGRTEIVLREEQDSGVHRIEPVRSHSDLLRGFLP